MSSLRIQHCFQGPSGEAKDTYCNTFHVTSPDGAPAPTLYANINAAIKAFYARIKVPTNSMFSTVVNNAGASIKIYDLADPPTRVPVSENFYQPAFVSGGQANLPNEVSICLSYNAEPQAGAIRARNRGRIYLGPLNAGAMENVVTSGEAVVGGALRTNISAAAVELRAALFAINVVWCIYSASTYAGLPEGTNHDLAMFPIFDFTVDDRFDTQRRRGGAPTAKTVTHV
jgi:hypothetical protein